MYNTTKKWYIGKTLASWTEASKICQSNNLELGSFENENEDHFILNFFEHKKIKSWIKASVSEQTKLSSSKKVLENCPLINIRKDYNVDYVACTQKYRFICQSVENIIVNPEFSIIIDALNGTIQNYTKIIVDLKNENDQLTSNLMNCKYNYINQVYSCSIEGLEISKENIEILISGAHQLGKKDDDVFELNISKSNTKYLTKSLFYKFEKLRNIKIIESKLQSLSKGVFSGAEYLRKIIIGGNNITKITSETFEGAENLNVLNLENNQIEFIEPNAFKGLEFLTFLNLNYNKLKEIPATDLKNMVNLMYLKVSANLFDKLDGDLLNKNTLLREVWFEDNKIYKIGSNLLKYSTQLQRAVFSDNICIDNDSEHTCIINVQNDIVKNCKNQDQDKVMNVNVWPKCPTKKKPPVTSSEENFENNDEDDGSK